MFISLGYHDIVAKDFGESGFPGADADRYKFTEAEFESHLDALGAAGVAPGSAAAVYPQRSGEVYLTFDDGGAGAALSAVALERRGWRGHYFISTDWIGKRGFLAAREIAALHRRGHVIGSHSCSHPARMSSKSVEFIAREWRESARILAEITGEPVVVGAVPGGFYSRMVGEQAAAAGYRTLFTSEPVTRVELVGTCRILGRYAVMRGIAPAEVAAIASGQSWPRARQWAYWNFKKALKAVGGETWLQFRRRTLAIGAAFTRGRSQ